MCLPVVQEILQGFRDEQSLRVARAALLAMPMVESPLGRDVFLEAADLFRQARRAGLTVRSGVDCLIATCAIRNDLLVLHHDRDYSALARVSPLRQRSVGNPRSSWRHASAWRADRAVASESASTHLLTRRGVRWLIPVEGPGLTPRDRDLYSTVTLFAKLRG